MFQYKCLNPISQTGLGLFGDGKVRSHGPRGRAERRGGLLSDKAV